MVGISFHFSQPKIEINCPVSEKKTCDGKQLEFDRDAASISALGQFFCSRGLPLQFLWLPIAVVSWRLEPFKSSSLWTDLQSLCELHFTWRSKWWGLHCRDFVSRSKGVDAAKFPPRTTSMNKDWNDHFVKTLPNLSVVLIFFSCVFSKPGNTTAANIGFLSLHPF